MIHQQIDFNKINEKYGALLGDLSFMQFGICDKLLPFSKQDIETALLTQAVYCKSKGDQKATNVMVYGYMHLALFITREKYDIVKEAYLPDGLPRIKADIELKEKFFKIQDEIMSDMKKRNEHICRILGTEISDYSQLSNNNSSLFYENDKK